MSLEITLGPLLFFWPREEVLAFYEKVSDSVVDRVYLGEVVCSKRREMKLKDWLVIASMLQDKGKEVVFSTMTLVEAESELTQIRRVCENGDYQVEANDMAAVHYLSKAGVPFYTGPSVNLYSAESLKVLYELGLRRWVMPVELSCDHLREIMGQIRAQDMKDLETEVFSYGYLPLAYSARCFTARTQDLTKDSCNFACLKSAAGIPLATQEGETLFTLNGIQTMSGHCHTILDQWEFMKELGVAGMRLSAHSQDILQVADDLATRMGKATAGPESSGSEQCNGYWFGQEGNKWVRS